MADPDDDYEPPDDLPGVQIEEFMQLAIAPLLPCDRNGDQYETFHRNIGLTINAKTGKKDMVYSRGDDPKCTHQPELTLADIRRLADGNDYKVSPLKNCMKKASHRAMAWHIQWVPNLVCFDVDGVANEDDPKLNAIFDLNLPYTKSFRGNGYHFYFICEDIPESQSDTHGVPRTAINCLIDPNQVGTGEGQDVSSLDHLRDKGILPMSIGDLFIPSHQFSIDDQGNKKQTCTMFERPSIKGRKQYAYNFNPEIGLPVLPFEEMRPFMDPKMWDVIPPDPEKELRKQRAKEKREEYKMLGEDSDLARGFTAEDVLFLLKHISPDRKRTNGWIQVGAFLKMVCCETAGEADYPCFENAFDVWNRWSAEGDSYNPNEMQSCWRSLTRDQVGFGTLVTHARNDGDEAEVTEYLAQRFKKATAHFECDYSQTNCAELLRIHMNDMMCDSEISSKIERLFEINNGGIWTRTNVTRIGQKIIKTLIPELKDTLSRIQGKMVALGDADDDDTNARRDTLKKKSDIVKAGLKSLKVNDFQNSVFEQMCKIVAYTPVNGKQLDLMWNESGRTMWLVPFQNVVYDLKAGVFRSALPAEYVAYTTGYNWPKENGELVMPEEEEIDECWQILSEIFATENQMRYVMTILAANLCADNFYREIVFLIGSAGNGKGLLMDLLENMYGDLFGSIDVAFFQTRNRNVGGPTPAVANLKRCRFVIASEPSKDVPFMADKIKLWNGDDPVECRGLNRAKDTFDMQFPLWFQMNEPTKVDNPNDPGVKRRQVMIEFFYKFLDVRIGGGGYIFYITPPRSSH